MRIAPLQLKLLAFLPSAILLPGLLPAQTQTAVPGCLPGSAAWLSGIVLGSTPEEVERNLGPPLERETGRGEDDGGPYEEIGLIYPRIQVFIVRGIVDRVTTSNPEVCTMAGLCPGMTADQVRERLARLAARPVASSPESFVICGEESFLGDYYFHIYYTPTDEVASLELVMDRP